MGPVFPVHVEQYISPHCGGEGARGVTRLPSEQPKALGRWGMTLARCGTAVGPSCHSPPQMTGSASPSEGAWPRGGGIYPQIWICPPGLESPTEGTGSVPAAVGRAVAPTGAALADTGCLVETLVMYLLEVLL